MSGILNHVEEGKGKCGGRLVDDLFKSLDLDKGELPEGIESSSASFLAVYWNVLVKDKVGGLKRDIILKLKIKYL